MRTGILLDLLGFAGAGFIAYGSWLIYQPAGFIVGGTLLLVMVTAATIGRRKQRKAADDGIV